VNCDKLLVVTGVAPKPTRRSIYKIAATRDVFDIGDVLICLRADGDNPHGDDPFDLLPPLMD
jgi:hypothetical protein